MHIQNGVFWYHPMQVCDKINVVYAKLIKFYPYFPIYMDRDWAIRRK